MKFGSVPSESLRMKLRQEKEIIDQVSASASAKGAPNLTETRKTQNERMETDKDSPKKPTATPPQPPPTSNWAEGMEAEEEEK